MIEYKIRGAGFSDRHLHVTVTFHETTVELGLLGKDETLLMGMEMLRAVDELFEHSGVFDYTDKRISDLLKQAQEFMEKDET